MGKGKNPMEFGGIGGPDIPPPNATDPITEKEVKKVRKQTRGPSPSERHAEAVARHVAYLNNDCKRLRKRLEAIQAELEEIKPRHSALEESYRASLASNVFSTAMVGLGGALISGAGYASEAIKLVILSLGAATFFWGFLLQATATWRASLFRPTGSSSGGRTHPTPSPPGDRSPDPRRG